MGLVFVWFLYWLSYISKLSDVPGQVFACLILPLQPCQFLQMATKVAGGPTYDPFYFWIPALVTVVGFVWWFMAGLKD